MFNTQVLTTYLFSFPSSATTVAAATAGATATSIAVTSRSYIVTSTATTASTTAAASVGGGVTSAGVRADEAVGQADLWASHHFLRARTQRYLLSSPGRPPCPLSCHLSPSRAGIR